jgi:hypothetical protein
LAQARLVLGTLLYLLLNDLFAHNRLKLFYFGPGAFDYNRWFSNTEGKDRLHHDKVNV